MLISYSYPAGTLKAWHLGYLVKNVLNKCLLRDAFYLRYQKTIYAFIENNNPAFNHHHHH